MLKHLLSVVISHPSIPGAFHLPVSLVISTGAMSWIYQGELFVVHEETIISCGVFCGKPCLPQIVFYAMIFLLLLLYSNLVKKNGLIL